VCWSCGRSLPAPERVGSASASKPSFRSAPSPERPYARPSPLAVADDPAPAPSERAVLTRYFAEPKPVVKEGAERVPERPVYARPRVWWDQQVRWSTETGLGRRRPQGPPPPPAPSAPGPATGPPSPPPPRRATEPIRIVTAPPSTPAEWAARTRGSIETLEATESTATLAARRLTRLWVATLAVVLMFIAIGVLALVPPSVPEPDPNPLRGQAPSSAEAPGEPAGAPGEAGQPEAADAPTDTGAAPVTGEEAPAGSEGGLDPASRIMARINEARAEAGHGALVVDDDLEAVADRHVADMIDRGRLAHSPTDLLGRRVTNWRVLAESIGVGPSVTSLFEALMDSEADRRNLLDPAFHHVGVGATRTGDRLWVTVLFSDSRDPGTILD
jgi:uncharacterized protein YkwD